MATLLSPLIDAEKWFLGDLRGAGLGWGLAIVCLTLLVRGAMVPLTVRQFRARRELQRHLPELKRLQQRFRRDPERLQRETAAYYRRHGINPLAPLLPVLLQIPVFISLYYVMRREVRSGLLRHSGFLFIGDLGARPRGATAAVVVAAYAVSQLASSLIATRSLEGAQRWLTLALPLLFAGVVLRFPAGLAVYWLTSSLWGLGQNVAFWRLGARPDAAASTSPAPAKPPPPPRRARKRRRSGKRR